jgi:hypothetical protein
VSIAWLIALKLAGIGILYLALAAALVGVSLPDRRRHRDRRDR